MTRGNVPTPASTPTVICSNCRRSFVNVVRLAVFAAGMLVISLGGILLCVDEFVTMTTAAPGVTPVASLWTTLNADRQFVFDPPEWLAYALLSCGTVVVLYTIALPGRRSRGEHAHG